MAKKPTEKPALPVKVSFLSERDQGILELPIFVTRVRKRPQKKPTIKTKKAADDS
ncbi:hypothetical protein [Massilia aquatica]|uniref:hypothetical protein n=1 Tax=Massilia aquatica TaxID=2609000 RepID=UPI0014218A1B|nr:hypothetical protein [Massilia aquatica]